MTTNIKKLFLGEFLSQTVAVYTLYAIMFSERGGLTPAQIGLVLGTFALVTLLAEIPTGILADKFPRKYSLVASKLLLALGMLTWLLMPNLTGYLIGIILMGISDSMSSGAMQAYMYEDLGENSQQFTTYNTRLWAVMMSAFLVGSGLASLIGPRYDVLLILSTIVPLLGAIVFMTLTRDNVASTPSHLGLLKESTRYLFRTKTVLIASLFLIGLKSMVDLLIEYIPLYYRDAGVSVRYVPLVFFIGNAITIVMFWYGSRISGLMKRAELRWLLALCTMFIASRYFGTVSAVLGVYWFVRFTRVLFVFEEGEIQHMYKSRFRATITSINSMGSRLAMAIAIPLVGLATQKFYDDKVLTPVIITTGIFTACLVAIKLYQRKIHKEATT
jgi:MFS family permease